MIIDNLPKAIQEAMKARDTIRLTTLQMLKSAINYKRIELMHDLTNEDELAVVRSEAKKRRDAIEAYTKAGRNELAEKEQTELKILATFLPQQMSDEKLERIVNSTITKLGATSMADMGKVIGAVKATTKDAADGSRVSSLVKSKLQQK